jgi:hypothetical protein
MSIQSIKDWYKVLNWPKLPNFSSCHHATTWPEFKDNYLCCVKLQMLQDNILETLRSNHNTANVRLTGVPGSGKTSFLYHLMKKAKFDNQDDSLDQFVFYVFHADKAKDVHYKKQTRQEILYGLESFYDECGHINIFRRIKDRRDLNIKGKINKLVKYYKDNLELFNKRLIFIIDDVDLLEQDLAYKIAKSVIQDIGVRSIIKWVSIRGVTFDHYSGEIKKFFEQFFPTVYNVPDSSLRDIMQYRIDNLPNQNTKNPFSTELCDGKVLHLYDGNKRTSLSILKSVLEDNVPKSIKQHTDEKFIKNHIDRVAIYTLVSKGALTNIHLEHLRTLPQYPLPMDIIACIYQTSNINRVSGAINDIMQERCRKSPLWNSERKLQVKTTDLNFSIQKLIDENLIYRASKDMYKLTNKGKILNHYLMNDTYTKHCLSLVPSLDKNEQYDDFVDININYEKLVKNYISWIDVHSPKSGT